MKWQCSNKYFHEVPPPQRSLSNLECVLLSVLATLHQPSPVSGLEAASPQLLSSRRTLTAGGGGQQQTLWLQRSTLSSRVVHCPITKHSVTSSAIATWLWRPNLLFDGLGIWSEASFNKVCISHWQERKCFIFSRPVKAVVNSKLEYDGRRSYLSVFIATRPSLWTRPMTSEDSKPRSFWPAWRGHAAMCVSPPIGLRNWRFSRNKMPLVILISHVSWMK